MPPHSVVYAIHNFEAENEDELEFSVGEPIIILEKDEKYMDGWWKGRNSKGETGLFPMNYTTPNKSLSSSHSTQSFNHSPSLGEGFIPTPQHSTQLPGLPSSNPIDWDVNSVSRWLSSVGLDSVAHTFIDQEITGDVLLDLTLDSLKELGITAYGKRYKVMNAINSLRGDTQPARAGRSTPSIHTSESYTTTGPMDGRSPLSRPGTSTKLSISGPPSPVESDSHYPYPRKTPLSSRKGSVDESDDYKHYRAQGHPDMVRPASPQSLASSSISLSNGFNTYSSKKSSSSTGTYRSRESSNDIRSAASPSRRKLSQRSARSDIKNDSQFSTMSSSSSQSKSFIALRDEYMNGSVADPAQPEHHQLPNSFKLSVSSPRARDADASQIPEREGWLYKQSEKYKTWNKRWFVLKGTNLFYFKNPKEVRMKGIINLRGYRIATDDAAPAGKYGFKARHERERTFFFYTDSEESMRAWVQMLMKTTIARDYQTPVMSSNQIATVPLDMARRMRPRPPSVIMYKNQKSTKGDAKMEMLQEEEELSREYDFEESDIVTNIPLMLKGDVFDGSHLRKNSACSGTTCSSTSSSHSWTTSDYIAWVNAHLPAKKQVKDLSHSFRDGEVLIDLLEQLCHKEVRRPSANKSGSISMMMLDNIVAAFKFMGRECVPIDDRYTIKDILSGEESKIKMLIDTLKEWSEEKMLGKSSLPVMGKQMTGSVYSSEHDLNAMVSDKPGLQQPAFFMN